MLLQVVLAGFATAAVENSSDVEHFAPFCVSQNIDAPDGAPIVPPTHHKSGCCIIHCGGLAAAPVAPVSVIVLNHAAPAVVSIAHYRNRIDGLRRDPELSPLSPRAPPVGGA